MFLILYLVFYKHDLILFAQWLMNISAENAFSECLWWKRPPGTGLKMIYFQESPDAQAQMWWLRALAEMSVHLLSCMSEEINNVIHVRGLILFWSPFSLLGSVGSQVRRGHLSDPTVTLFLVWTRTIFSRKCRNASAISILLSGLDLLSSPEGMFNDDVCLVWWTDSKRFPITKSTKTGHTSEHPRHPHWTTVTDEISHSGVIVSAQLIPVVTWQRCLPTPMEGEQVRESSCLQIGRPALSARTLLSMPPQTGVSPQPAEAHVTE